MKTLDRFALEDGESASAAVGPSYDNPSERKTDYHTILTKQTHNAPAP
jgi:hypothetical protein